MGRSFIVAAAVSGIAVCGALCAGPGPAWAAASAVHSLAAHPVAAVTPRVADQGTLPVWAVAQEIPGLGALDQGGFPFPWALSCTSPGDCDVGGSYDQAAHTEAFVAARRDGTWGSAIELPGTAALNTGGDAAVTAISCTATGDCTAGGFYSPGGTAAGGYFTAYEAFVATETDGVWGTTIEVPGTAALDVGHYAGVGSVSCWSPGNCTAAGSYATGGSVGPFPDTQAFTVTETDGIWSSAAELPGGPPASLNPEVGVYQISCPQAGSCALGGGVVDSAVGGAFVADESGGRWQPAKQVSGIAALSSFLAKVTSVSCASPGNCGAAGSYPTGSDDAAFVVTETGGTWGEAQPLAGAATANSISCPAAGDCVAGGAATAEAGPDAYQAYVVSQVGGTWGRPLLLPGMTETNDGEGAGTVAISCSAPEDCGAGGGYADAGWGSSQPFVVTETDGTWGLAEPLPGIATLNSADQGQVLALSCATPQACTAAGIGEESDFANVAFVVSTGTATDTTAALSETTVTYGREQAERVSVTVTAKTGGPPDGEVTVRAGSAELCVITLAAGQGSCTPAAAAIVAGTVKVSALFDGTPVLAPSAAPAGSLVIAKASSSTSFAMSAATVTYGHEHTDRLTVTVLPQYGGIPASHVLIKTEGRTLCVITLHSATGACRLPAARLSPGTYRLVAVYPGNAGFTPSRSPAQTLFVGRAGTAGPRQRPPQTPRGPRR